MAHEKLSGPRARVKISHQRAYDFDETRGVYLYRNVDEDEEVWNTVTNAGRVQLHTFCYGTSSRPNGFRYIGISGDGSAPAAGDTSLAGELSGNGLTRVAGSVTLPTGSGTQTTIANTFTYSAAGPQVVQKAALFDSLTLGVMAHEIQFSSRNLFLNDTIALSFVITLA